MEGLGERIRALRESLGTERQKDFAEKLGFNKRQMGAWERDEAEPPAEFFRAVAAKFGFEEVQKLLLGNETGTGNALRENGPLYGTPETRRLAADLARHPHLSALVRKLVAADDVLLQRAKSLSEALDIPEEIALLVLLKKEERS